MSWLRSKDNFKLLLIILWLVFTVAFAVWWLRLSEQHITWLAELQPEHAGHWERQRRMVFWEGLSWIVLLALGGTALITLVQNEKRRLRQVREFFASFTHEVKTSLASLRLQAESLKEDLGWANRSPVLDRLIGDTVRLQVQLENSLFLSSQDDLRLITEDLKLARMVDAWMEQWPHLKILTEGNVTLKGDARALRTILNNLAQNASIHGQATELRVQAQAAEPGRVSIVFTDNGKGFKGELSALGSLFHRATNTSGSGLGLYISRLLCERMHGSLTLEHIDKGFRVRIVLPGAAS